MLRRRASRWIGKAESEIFVAQKMILEDAALQKRVIELVRSEQVNAEDAVTRTLDEYESRLLQVDNEYLKERASDMGEIKRRLLQRG